MKRISVVWSLFLILALTLLAGCEGNGVVVPPGTNTNQTVYLIRHAEAHPTSSFEDGNFVGAGQWRALSLPNFLPNALRGQASPTVVYSIDPAQSFALAADRLRHHLDRNT